MRTAVSIIPVLAFGALATAPAATTVDWLALQPGASSANFQLAEDGVVSTYSASMTISNGLAIAPSSITFADASWVLEPDLVDSVTNDATLLSTQFRVAPQAGQTVYSITFSVPAGRPMFLAIGGLLRSSTSATQYVDVDAVTDSGTSLVGLHSINAWSSSPTILTQTPSWDAPTQRLSIGPNNGDSSFAFLEVAPLTGANPRIVLSVPQGYATGTGDSIYVSVGVVPVPEPATTTILGLAGVALFNRRRRPTA